MVLTHQRLLDIDLKITASWHFQMISYDVLRSANAHLSTTTLSMDLYLLLVLVITFPHDWWIHKVFVFFSYHLVQAFPLFFESWDHLVQFCWRRSCDQGIWIQRYWICTCPSSLSVRFCLIAVYEASIYISMQPFLCLMYTKRKSQKIASSKWSVHCCQFGTLFIQRYLPIFILCI